MSEARQTLSIAGASVRAAAQSAARAGFEVFAADLFGDLDTRAAACYAAVEPYPAALRDVLEAAPPGPWIYTGALENEPDLIEAISSQRELWGNASSVVRRVRDPWILQAALRSAQFDSPRLRRPGESKSEESSQWLSKPLRSAGGHGIVVERDAPPSGHRYLQEFIAGTPCALSFVAAGGRARLLQVSRQLIGEAWTGGRDYWYCGSVSPFPVRDETRTQAERLGDVLASQFDLRGAFGVDVILTQDGRLVTLEVNPRYTSSAELWERLTHRSMVGEHAAACLAGRLLALAELPTTRAAGKAIVYATSDLTIDRRKAETLARWNENPGREYELADIPYLPPDAAGQSIARGRPIATVLVEGETAESVLTSLKEAANSLTSSLA